MDAPKSRQVTTGDHMGAKARADSAEELLAHWLAARVRRDLRRAVLPAARRLFMKMPGGIPGSIVSRLLLSFDEISRLPVDEETDRTITAAVMGAARTLVERSVDAARRDPRLAGVAAVLADIVASGGRARDLSIRPWRGPRHRVREWFPDVAVVEGWAAGPRDSLLLLPIVAEDGRCRGPKVEHSSGR